MQRSQGLQISMSAADELRTAQVEADLAKRKLREAQHTIAGLKLALAEADERAEELGAELLQKAMDESPMSILGGANSLANGTGALDKRSHQGSLRGLLRRQRTSLFSEEGQRNLRLSRWPDLKVDAASEASEMRKPCKSVSETRILGAAVKALQEEGPGSARPIILFFAALFGGILLLKAFFFIVLR